MRARALALILLWGCKESPALPNYEGWPLWLELDLADAIDLGHTPTETEVAPPGPLRFEEQAEALGLGEVRGGGNTHGVGVALVDLDADGWLDAVVANGRSNATGELYPSALYWNRGGAFTDGTASLGGALQGRDLYSVAAGDVDNDGDVDLYFGGQPYDVLLANQGDGTFADVSEERGARGPASDPELVADGRSKVVSIGDIDGDGWLDLVSATSTRPSPGVAVLLNRGDGTFRDATRELRAAIAPDGHPCAVMFTDYDNDGQSDLWIWNDRGGHVLLHGRREGGEVFFQNFGNRADQTSIRNPMGIDAADLDHDGDLDYYVSNIGDHPLLINQGDGTFEDRTDAMGTQGDFGWGLAFEDFDLDGWADLYVTQEDALPVLAYRNEEGRRFERFILPVPPNLSNGAAHNVPAAFGDIDRDGRVDVLWARTDGSKVVLHQNSTETGGRHWLEVAIASTPGTGERGGISARVAVSAGGLVQFRDIAGGSSRASQNALSARFGLGAWSGADWVVVAWQDGRTLAFTGVPGDETLVIEP